MKGARHPVAVTLVAAALAVPAVGAAGQHSPGSDRDRPVVVEVRDSGFDWGSAAIGAAAAFGFVLLTAGTVVVLRPVTRSQDERRRHV